MFRGLLTALFVALALTFGGHAPAYAADPSTTATPGATVFVDPLDPRAGLSASTTGAPAIALLFVVGLGLTVATATFVFVRVRR